MSFVLLQLVLLLITVSACPGWAHNCYQCTSTKSVGCADPGRSLELNATYCVPGREMAPVIDVLPDFFSALINGVMAVVASFSPPSHVDMLCVKLVFTQAGEDATTTLRFCSPKDSGMVLCQRVREVARNSTSFCGVCHRDGCNQASGGRPVVALLLLAPLLCAWSSAAS